MADTRAVVWNVGGNGNEQGKTGTEVDAHREVGDAGALLRDARWRRLRKKKTAVTTTSVWRRRGP
jgi:hypothetical protein